MRSFDPEAGMVPANRQTQLKEFERTRYVSRYVARASACGSTRSAGTRVRQAAQEHASTRALTRQRATK
jgi:hypothetical protein